MENFETLSLARRSRYCCQVFNKNLFCFFHLSNFPDKFLTRLVNKNSWSQPYNDTGKEIRTTVTTNESIDEMKIDQSQAIKQFARTSITGFGSFRSQIAVVLCPHKSMVGIRFIFLFVILYLTKNMDNLMIHY